MKTYDELMAERNDAMREASVLAMSIWRSEFRNESPEFELCDSPAGVVTQIDNMFAGIRQQRDALKYHLSRVLSAYGGNSGFEPSLSVFLRAIDDAKDALSTTPSQCLAEIKAEAVLCFATYIDSTGELSGDDCTFIIDEANQYAAKIRNTGTWLKDSNVNGGKRQGGAE